MENVYLTRFKENAIHAKLKLITTDTGIRISKALINYRMVIDICLTILAIYFTYTIDDKAFYLIPILFVWAILFGMIWNDFQSINYIFIDTTGKIIKISSRNVIKRFLVNHFTKDKNNFPFNYISDFPIKRNFGSKADIDIYVVGLKTDLGKYLPLLTFRKEENAKCLSDFLNDIIK